MIEHPEAVTIARQIDDALSGKKIRSAVRGNSPHKFAFYTRTPEEYASILKGRTLTGADPSGSLVLLRFGKTHILVFGGGGERIQYHSGEETIPKKHQMLLRFTDDTYLTVKVQGWGSCQLWTPRQLGGYPWYANRSLEPTDPGFTYDYFKSLLAPIPSDDARSVKYFIISEPGIWGIGNGYLQDILLAAKIHPRTRVAELNGRQIRSLYGAITRTIARAVKLQGRTDEYGIYGEKGRYERALSTSVTGKPCPKCGDGRIVKESFLGGAIYTCPVCQVAPPKPVKQPRRRKK